MLAIFKCLSTQHRLNRDKANKPMSFCFYNQVFVLLSQLFITPSVVCEQNVVGLL